MATKIYLMAHATETENGVRVFGDTPTVSDTARTLWQETRKLAKEIPQMVQKGFMSVYRGVHSIQNLSSHRYQPFLRENETQELDQTQELKQIMLSMNDNSEDFQRAYDPRTYYDNQLAERGIFVRNPENP